MEVCLIRCSSEKCHLLASDGADLGPDCYIPSYKHILHFHDIMEARGTKPVSCRSTSQDGETNGLSPYLRTDKLARLAGHWGLNLEYSVATFFSSASRGG